MNSVLLLEHSLHEDPDIFMLECSEWEYNLQMEQADFMLEMVNFKESQNVKRMELKVLMENGTEDDLNVLYEQIVTESETEKKGIFATIWGGICSIFRSISETISKVINNITGNDNKVEVPKSYYDCAKSSFTKIKEWMPKILTALAVATGVAAITYSGKKLYDAHKAKQPDGADQKQLPDKKEGMVQKLLNASDQALLTAAQDKVTAINESLAVIEKDSNATAMVAVTITDLTETVKGVKEVSDDVAKTSNAGWVANAVKNALAAPLISCIQKVASVGSKITKALLEKLTSVKEVAGKVADKAGVKKKNGNGEVEHLEGEVVTASAEDDTTGDPTFEAGSLEDIMTLIADL